MEGLVYFMAIWDILRSFGIFYGRLVDFVIYWYILHALVCCTKKDLASLLHTWQHFEFVSAIDAYADASSEPPMMPIDIVVNLDGENNKFLGENFMDNSMELILQ
jgi:hypothetical protein